MTLELQALSNSQLALLAGMMHGSKTINLETPPTPTPEPGGPTPRRTEGTPTNKENGIMIKLILQGLRDRFKDEPSQKFISGFLQLSGDAPNEQQLIQMETMLVQQASDREALEKQKSEILAEQKKSQEAMQAEMATMKAAIEAEAKKTNDTLQLEIAKKEKERVNALVEQYLAKLRFEHYPAVVAAVEKVIRQDGAIKEGTIQLEQPVKDAGAAPTMAPASFLEGVLYILEQIPQEGRPNALRGEHMTQGHPKNLGDRLAIKLQEDGRRDVLMLQGLTGEKLEAAMKDHKFIELSRPGSQVAQ